jgi:hypothetical protein
MTYKIKNKSESQLMMEKNNRLMLKIDREREKRRKKWKEDYEKTPIHVEIDGKTKIVKANLFKLTRTMFNRKGEKYTKKEMKKMGFEKKK